MYEPNEYDLELMTEFSDDGKNENENEIIEFYNYNYGFDYLNHIYIVKILVFFAVRK